MWNSFAYNGLLAGCFFEDESAIGESGGGGCDAFLPFFLDDDDDDDELEDELDDPDLEGINSNSTRVSGFGGNIVGLLLSMEDDLISAMCDAEYVYNRHENTLERFSASNVSGDTRSADVDACSRRCCCLSCNA